MKPTLRSLWLTAACVVLYFGLVEIAVRTVIDDGMRYDLEMWKYAKQLKQISTNSGIGHEHRPGSAARLMGVEVSINSGGQRDREFAQPKPKGTTRIVMLGDSLTFGWGVARDQTVSKRLEVLLNQDESEHRYEVVNAGVGNYNAAMSSHWMRARGMALEPDLVVFNYSFNDAELTPRREGGGLAEWSYAWIYFAGRFGEVSRRVLGGRDWRAYYADLYAEDADGWRRAQEEIRLLAAFCEKQGVPLFMVDYPELHQLQPYPLAEVSGRVRALSDSLGLPYLELLESVRGEAPEDLWVTPGDPHPNGRATELMARAIFGFLRETGPDHALAMADRR